MGCECWNRQIQEDHRVLDSERKALKAVLEKPVGLKDLRVHLLQILRSLEPRMKLHLRREEEVLFPAFEHLLGGGSGVLTLLKDQHDELRALLDKLSELLWDRESSSWQNIAETGESLIALLETHEEKEGRFMVDILESSLQPQQLMDLARQFQRVASKLCQEEP